MMTLLIHYSDTNCGEEPMISMVLQCYGVDVQVQSNLRVEGTTDDVQDSYTKEALGNVVDRSPSSMRKQCTELG